MPTRFLMGALTLLVAACDGGMARSQEPSQALEQAVPVELTGRVVDEAGLLSPSVEQELAASSQALERETSDQLVVVALKSLNGAEIEQVGYALGNSWGVGHSDRENGVLLLVAPNERKVRIEVGSGLEALLTDERSASIVRNMLPLLQRGDYEGAMRTGVGDIATLLRSDRQRPRYRQERKAA